MAEGGMEGGGGIQGGRQSCEGLIEYEKKNPPDMCMWKIQGQAGSLIGILYKK